MGQALRMWTRRSPTSGLTTMRRGSTARCCTTALSAIAKGSPLVSLSPVDEEEALVLCKRLPSCGGGGGSCDSLRFEQCRTCTCCHCAAGGEAREGADRGLATRSRSRTKRRQEHCVRTQVFVD